MESGGEGQRGDGWGWYGSRKGSEYTEEGAQGVGGSWCGGAMPADGLSLSLSRLRPSLPLSLSLTLTLYLGVSVAMLRIVVVAVASKKMERKEDGWNSAQG